MGRGGTLGDLKGRLRPTGFAARLFVVGALVSLVLGSILVFPAPKVGAQVSLTVTMGDLFFEPGSFATDPGANVTLRLVNGGALRHTFTLFAEADAQVPVDDNAALQDFYARSPTLVDVDFESGRESTVNFTVPETEGSYTYVCIVPGHSVNGMHGLMFVGVTPGDGNPFGGIGIVQGLFLITLIGVVVFAVIYQIRSGRP